MEEKTQEAREGAEGTTLGCLTSVQERGKEGGVGEQFQTIAQL